MGMTLVIHTIRRNEQHNNFVTLCTDRRARCCQRNGSIIENESRSTSTVCDKQEISGSILCDEKAARSGSQKGPRLQEENGSITNGE